MQQGMSLQSIIEQVSKEKGIDPTVLVETMEQAILTAAKRTFGMTRELEARFSDETGNVDLYQFMTVVEEVEDPEREISIEDARRYGFEDAQIGEDLGFQIFYLPEDSEEAKKQDRQYGDLLKLQQHHRGFGRIAAQTAKQVIIQRVRDAERELIFNEYKDRKGELITGIVRRFERGSNIIVDLGRTEAILPTREQTPRESYRPGDRIVAWDRDPARFVCNAIAPAEVSRVVIDEGHGGMELVVPDAKLSLAIGRRGQNVRLASQLTGWKLDIISEARFRQMEEQAISELGRIASADEDMVKSFYRMGFRSLDEVAEAQDDELMTIDGIKTADIAARIRREAADAMESHRFERVEEAKARPDSFTEREHLLLARGVTERIVEALEHSGYRSVADVLRENDVDRLAIRTGLGTHKAHEVKNGVARYVEDEMEAVKEAQREARARAEAEAEATGELAGDEGAPLSEGLSEE